MLYFGSSFNETVIFDSQTGILELTQSQSYTKSVTGTATRGQGDILDLNDIGFVGSGEATYVDNGQHIGGVLTGTYGVHTTHIDLVGESRPGLRRVQRPERRGRRLL